MLKYRTISCWITAHFQNHTDSLQKAWYISKTPSPGCKGTSTPYLQTLAYCLEQYCLNDTSAGIALPRVVDFWRDNVQKGADMAVPSFQQVRSEIKNSPNTSVPQASTLNFFGYVPESRWSYQREWLVTYRTVETNHQKFGLIIFVTCAIIPIVLSSIRFLPWPPTFVSKFRGYVIDPPLIGSRHSEAVGGVFMMPTRGQALFIFYIWAINMLLVGLGYHCNTGNTCNPSYKLNETNRLHSVANRLGVLSFANLPLLILFAGRNNMILWVTNWSRTTFLMIHRYVAFICMGEAVAHAVIFMYIEGTALSTDGLRSLLRKPYWVGGAIATLSLLILVATAIQPLRKRLYETFMVIHLLFTILVLTGCYIHNFTRFGTKRGHEIWLYIATGIWAFDRIVRFLRYMSRGVRTAYITTIDENYYRVDIPGVHARGHIYVHFLAISKWKLWESHPFSVGSITSWQEEKENNTCVETTGLRKNFNFFENAPGFGVAKGCEEESGSASRGPSLSTCEDSTDKNWMKGTGVTLLVRRERGLTAHLKDPGTTIRKTPVLIEGSYNEEMTRLQENHVRPTDEFPNIICVAAGVGITGALPFLDKFEAKRGQFYTKKLIWAVRSMPLVRAVEDMVLTSHDTDSADRRWGDVDVKLCIGARPNVSFVLHRLLYRQSGGTIVVVCGPAPMSDEVRCFVSRIARDGGYGDSKMKVRVIVECFSW